MPLLLIVLDKLMITLLVELLLLLGIKLRQYKKLMILLVVFPNNDIHFSRVSDPSNFDVDPDPDPGNHIWDLGKKDPDPHSVFLSFHICYYKLFYKIQVFTPSKAAV